MPALLVPPSFVDGSIVTFDDLNNLTVSTDALAQIVLGRPLTSSASSKPVCKVNLAANRSVGNNQAAGSAEVITWDHVVRDSDGIFDPTFPNYLTIQTPGWYWIFLQVQWASGAATARVAQLSVNGTSDPLNVTSSVNTVMGASGVVTQQCISYEHLDAGASVYGMSFQNSGGALNMLANSRWGTSMSVAYADPF